MNTDLPNTQTQSFTESQLFFVPVKYSFSPYGLWGLTDKDGEQLVPPIYRYIYIDESEPSSPIIVQNLDEEWGYLDEALTYVANDAQTNSIAKTKTRLHEGKTKKPNEFNKQDFSITNLGGADKWGISTKQGQISKFDSEAIEPYVNYNIHGHQDFAARESYWTPVLTESREFAYVNPQGKIGLRVHVKLGEEHDIFIVKDDLNKEIWQHNYPTNSLLSTGYATFNIGAKELGYIEPTAENIKELVDELRQKVPLFFNVTYDDLGEDVDSETYGVGSSLAYIFHGEETIWAFGSLLELPNLNDKYLAYQKTITSVYGEPLGEISGDYGSNTANTFDEEIGKTLEENGIGSYYDTYATVWGIDNHLLILYGGYHFDDEAYNTLSLLLLPRSGRP